jgi:uroporphyrinogen decarboxylase
MTPRQRLLTVLQGRIPDCVPVAPDFSNMIPARLTGKPFWDLYLYNDPPIWEAYIQCARHFNIDSLMDGYFPLQFPEDIDTQSPPLERFIIARDDSQIIVQESFMENGRRRWLPRVNVYYASNPPSFWVDPAKINLPAEPRWFEPLTGVKPVDISPNGLSRIKTLMGDQGLVGVWLTWTCTRGGQDGIYEYYDHPERHDTWAAEHVEKTERKFAQIMSMPVKPDFLCCGASGTMIWQTVEMFRKISLPGVKRGIELATAAGIPTHVHSCGPEKNLVKILAEETDLTVIDPLEIPPMGDCNLAELKQAYGKKITLKGNLHTTEVMLRGTVETVVAASRQAIDDAGAGGRFILSTGDQCGRDTPDANLQAMIDTARTYGRY